MSIPGIVSVEGGGNTSVLGLSEAVPDLPANVRAWTTTRHSGSFGLGSGEAVGEVMARWAALQEELAQLGVSRLANAHQVHGNVVTVHGGGWRGWLRGRAADGHVTARRGTALAVTVADCTPVLVWHPAGAVAALHAGWRGTAARILDHGLDSLVALGFPSEECHVWLGPAICGGCYEVGPEVLTAIHGAPHAAKGQLDVRAILGEQALARRVASVRTAAGCARCHTDRYFSHRAGDTGRMLGVIALL
ncbi:polyphenol oxidase family protein [Gemmatimonas sp.]